MPKVVLCERIHEEGIKLLKQYAEVIIAPDPSEETLVNAVAEADALIVRSSPLTVGVIQAGKKLKVIGRHGIGVDNIDVESATRHQIAVVNTPDANTISVAEHVISVMLYLCKRLKDADVALRNGEFDQPGSLPGLVTKLGYTTVELYGKTLGLIGVGKIARRVALACSKGFGMNVVGFDPLLQPAVFQESGVTQCATIDEVFAFSDFVSIHVPLSKATRNLITEKQISVMKPSAYIINSARGGVLNEEDLYCALKARTIAGAAVDVFATEPPSQNHPLFQLSNILVTPHMAAMTDGALLRMAKDVAENVIMVLKGKRPQFLVNPEVWTNLSLSIGGEVGK